MEFVSDTIDDAGDSPVNRSLTMMIYKSFKFGPMFPVPTINQFLICRLEKGYMYPESPLDYWTESPLNRIPTRISCSGDSMDFFMFKTQLCNMSNKFY